MKFSFHPLTSNRTFAVTTSSPAYNVLKDVSGVKHIEVIEANTYSIDVREDVDMRSVLFEVSTTLKSISK